MNTTDDPFLTALEALTKPTRTKIIQDGPIGSGLTGQKTVTIELPPLLKQLEDAITATIGIGGSGSLAHERNMLDADALYRFTLISSTVKDWARTTNTPITPTDVGATLTSWYVAYRSTPRTFESEQFHKKMMTGWAAQIREKLNPKKTREIPGACPVCEAETWWSKTTREEYPYPLVTEYDPEVGANMIQTAKSMCRACENVWGVRELAYLLEQNDTHNNNVAETA